MEKEEFAKVLMVQAAQENGRWFIEEEGPILDMMRVVEALVEGKHVALHYK